MVFGWKLHGQGGSMNRLTWVVRHTTSHYELDGVTEIHFVVTTYSDRHAEGKQQMMKSQPN